MKLAFYYWSYQCPLNHDMLTLLNKYKDSFDIEIYDITNCPELAKEMQMYYPTLFVVNDRYRFYSPLREEFLIQLSEGILPEEPPYIIPLGKEIVNGHLLRLDNTTLPIACLCTGGCGETSCERKQAFYRELHQECYGYIMVDTNQGLLGGAEYVSTLDVPYAIPKNADTAFITCVYASDTIYDYKSMPLKTLENALADDYKGVYVISDERGTFPNGDISFFMNHGYVDKGVIQKNAYCQLHLMYKKLK